MKLPVPTMQVSNTISIQPNRYIELIADVETLWL